MKTKIKLNQQETLFYSTIANFKMGEPTPHRPGENKDNPNNLQIDKTKRLINDVPPLAENQPMRELITAIIELQERAAKDARRKNMEGVCVSHRSVQSVN